MKDSTSDPTADIAREYLERENKEKQVLALLLENFLGRKDQILVQKTEMGGTEAYVSSVTLEWFAGRVHFASGLPLFQKKYNHETDNVEIDADSIDEIQQRPLDWSRQAPLVQYLAARQNHKFPPVLVVINQPWVDNSKAAEWDSEGRATKSTTDFIPLDKDAKVGLLNISDSTVLTTLQALQDMSERYLGQKFPHWKPLEKGLIPMRPEDEELEQGIEEFRKLFDYLASLSSYKILEHEDTPALRRFSFEKDGGEGNMLFRPVAQVALAQALGILVFKKGFSLVDIFKKLRKFDQQGGFSGMEYPQSLWYGVLYDPNKRRVQVAGRDLATKLLVYILGGIQEQMERAELRKALADARTVEDKTIGFDGKFVEPKAVGLPSVL
ncbi:DGQHR domain-containing protein [Nostoc sp. JL33]|uniref:DGQHR domain-containing protein n=1 Tax=Nostoc sp. JL33 TaxID=2815396 RepID=UPI0025EFC6A9|nr:DGQHR domain-containing protein [Nostoc sp. JL33]MBN3872855.1 DGQHR domain-containing protein [Nostoc sp. JL33]